MPTITRDETLAVVGGAVNSIMSATWKRRGDKKENRCPTCNATLARHVRQWVCTDHGVVNPVRITVANKGDLITRQFIPKINREKRTKHWTGVTKENSGKDGQCFNAPTREAADAIKRENGLVGVLKMSGDAGDKQGVPITIPVFDLQTITFEGTTYDIKD
jgi:hypothetical protein